MLSLAHSEKPHPNASPTVTFPMVLEENAKTNRGVVLLDAPWRWLVDNVGPEDHSEFAVTSSPVQQDPACSPWPTTELPHCIPEDYEFRSALPCLLVGLELEQSPC